MINLKLNSKLIRKVIFYLIAFIIIGFGIYFRLRLYLTKFPFWLDEMMLGLSFFDSNVINMFGELQCSQKCPPLFCFFVFIILKLFGYSYYSFRFIPIISSIISIFLFMGISFKLFKTKTAVLMSVLIFSVSLPLCYYSQEFKPYSTDVLVCLFLIFIYDYIHFKGMNNKSMFLYSVFAFLLPLLSFPTVFIIPAVICAKFIEEKCIDKKVGFIIISYFLVSLYLFLLYKNTYFYEKLGLEWQTGFLTFSFSSVKNILYEFFVWSTRIKNMYFLIVIILFVIAGLILLLKYNKKEGILLTLITGTFITASVFKIYPLTGRMILFMIPILILMIVKTIDDKELFSIKTIVLSLIIFISLNLIEVPRINFRDIYELEYRMPVSERELILETINNILKSTEENTKILTIDEIITYVKFYNYFLKYNKNISYSEINILNTQEEVQNILNKFLDENAKGKENGSKVIICKNFEEMENIKPELDFLKNQIEKTLKIRKIKYTKNKNKKIYWYLLNI